MAVRISQRLQRVRVQLIEFFARELNIYQNGLDRDRRTSSISGSRRGNPSWTAPAPVDLTGLFGIANPELRQAQGVRAFLEPAPAGS
jgi:hypothetical protein